MLSCLSVNGGTVRIVSPLTLIPLWAPTKTSDNHPRFVVVLGHVFRHPHRRIRAFICGSLDNLLPLSGDELVAQRYERFRALGRFDLLEEEDRKEAVKVACGASKPR